jgi:hypothetical protein
MVPPILERTAAARDRVRATLLARIPRWYSPWGHLAATTGVGLATLVIALMHLHAVRPIELLIVPAVFVVANAFEWRAHKHVLHRRSWPLEVIYDRHTPEHHAIYMTNDMAIRSTKEFRLVLIPAAGVLGIVISTAPIAYGVRLLFGPNVGWLFLMTAALYMVLYEISHLSYHLPPDSFIGRRRLVHWLREHHARHHDPRLMQKWNFNVTVPLFDWLFGTIAPKDIVVLGDEAPRREEPQPDAAKA